MIEKPANENTAPAEEKEKVGISDEERTERRLKLLRDQVAMLMDELKSLFIPQMKLTFIARDPSGQVGHTLLTEESDMEDFIEFLKNIPKPTPVDRPPAGYA